jgi:hypothetical protein
LQIGFQVSDNETMQINVTLVQHSCLDGFVYIRDGGGGGGGSDDVNRAPSSAVYDGRSHETKTKPDGELINRIGFFNRTPSSNGFGGGGFSFNSSRPIVTFELTSRNKSCRVNMQLKVVAVPAKSKLYVTH